MRKLLILIAFLPLVAAVGHDVYQFIQNKEKGFRFSDVGWLWEKYDPQSHQQVRQELNTLMEQAEENREPEMTAEPIEEPVPPAPAPLTPDLPPQTKGNQPPAEPGATQTPAPAPQTPEALDDETGKVRVIIKKKDALPKTTEVLGGAAGFAAFLMQQKAVVVAGGFAALMMLLMWICGSVKLGRKKDMDDDLLSNRKKGGNYKYSRK
ncbi:MAG: hypothetical protein KA099_10305 [Alphaproteobacteria bacterium]|nr:hypothetical protein [Alphaproteobacteria bacterium]